jgi:probable HAF family extracellular repeat protein
MRLRYFRQRIIVQLLATGSSLMAFVHPASATLHYSVTEIDPPNNDRYTYALSINNSGEICGTFGSNSTLFTYVNGVYHALSGATFTADSLANLNNNGDGVGYNTQTSSPTYWNGGKFTALAAPKGFTASSCFAENLNDDGEVVGLSGHDAFIGGVDVPSATPIVWQNGTPSVLPTLGGKGVSGAVGINDQGEIVGTSVNTKGVSEPVMWVNGKIKALGTLGGNGGTGVDVNDSGEVAGTAFTSSGAFHGFEWVNGHMTDLGPVFSVKAINDAGEIVGDTKKSPTMWVNGKAIDLNSLLPANSGWHLRDAADINDNGQIVGIGAYHGQEQAFLLSPRSGSVAGINAIPLPDPALIGLTTFPLAFIAARKYRRASV